MKILFLFVGVLFVLPTHAADCTQNKAGLTALLQGKEFYPSWKETTADDGKPLLIEMSTKGDKLYFVFDKTKEGIWAEGLISVCKEKNELVVKISKEDIKVGSKAPRVIRWTMSSGATFKLQLKDEQHLHVSTFGWKGDFIRKPQAIN